jgi:pimeloyl-ACP methyl ester carboxylesterase/membrane protein DedA with SNARE-associated domain
MPPNNHAGAPAPTAPDASRPEGSGGSRRRPRRRTILLIVYLVLLLASHVVRRIGPDEDHPAGPAVEVLAVDGQRTTDRSVRMAYLDLGPVEAGPRSTIVLLHGSPGTKADFGNGLEILHQRHRVVAPDLPGFGKSTRDVPDYSVRAHAVYVMQLLDELRIDKAHFVGFSMGSGVALHVYDLDPGRVESLTLLSGIGVQELELFGDYRMNHIIHGAQLATFWAIREGVPHMGALDDGFFGIPYARNFYDTDQRPLRGILERFEPPMLIVHGMEDFLVPPEAAIEHHRLVPQSEFQLLPASHFMIFLEGPDTARRVAAFVSRVDDGTASSRNEADPGLVAASREPFDPSVIPPYTGFALLIMTGLIVLATLISEDLACIAAGLLIAQGRIAFWPALIACFVGIFVGDLLLLLAGRYLGRPALRRAPLRWLIREEQVKIASRWFDRRGPIVIGVSRFLPGARLPIYFTAGMLHTNFWKFTFFFLLAVSVWTPALVGLSVVVGERAFVYFEFFSRHAPAALVLLGLWILIIAHVVVPAFTFHGRRKLYGRWRRIWNWEFWPPWVFYPPVVAYVAWLALWHRGPLLFTAANPSIEAGGFIAESKHRILEGLTGAGEFVARTRLIPASDDPRRRIEEAEQFISAAGVDYPVVLKPDAGQRGSGVVIARTHDQLASYLRETEFDTLVQEYAPGDEFGVFYYRYPNEERGRIFSITEKRIPFVTGDGRHTLEHLILSDRRAVCMADHYLTAQVDQLFRVPEAGEKVPLVELGTHCRGAIFLDGSWLLTGELENVIDAISRKFDGFFFGRYDVRTPDVEDFKLGLNFKIIELNGVTSEATHIYDPKISLFRAYATLFEQWRVAYEIGRQNREGGVTPAGPSEIWRLIRRYSLISRGHPG